jgi:hypothetical protein
MRPRTLAAALVALTAVMGAVVAGCGGSGDSADASSATTGAGTAPAPAVTSSASTRTAPAPRPPTVTARTLRRALAYLVDPATPPAARAATVVGGGDLTPTFTAVRAFLADSEPVNFHVSGLVVRGDRVRADVRVLSGGLAVADTKHSVFQRVGGRWHITRASACDLIAVSGIACPPASAD